MNALLELVKAGGPAVPIMMLMFLCSLPLLLLAALFSFVAGPTRRRLRVFALLALGAGILFLLVGFLGYSSGSAKLEAALATGELEDPARLRAIGMREARIPLWTGLVFATAAAITGGLFSVRGSQLRESPPGAV